jgi:hypothetical protein
MNDSDNANTAKKRQEFISLCKVLSTQVAYDTLISLLDGPKSVADICLENKTPLSSTYKVVKSFQQMGLVSVQDVLIDEHGKRVTLYKSKVKSLKINLNSNGVKVEYNSKDGESSSVSPSSDGHRNNNNASEVAYDNHKTKKETQVSH